MAKHEHSNAGTVALLAGGGALAWLLLHGKGFGLGGGGGGAQPPAGPCRVRLDSRTLTVDGREVTSDDAIATCGASGHALVLITGDAIAGVADQLLADLKRAGVAVAIENPTH